VKRDVATAYLRVAHTYMLISMPTATSTIFGAFQAIWLSFSDTGRNGVLGGKVLRIEKFASEIFCLQPRFGYAASRKDFTELCGVDRSKRRGIKPFAVVRSAGNDDFGFDGAATGSK
jgi:hypothetical protein